MHTPFLNLYTNRFLGDFVPVMPIIGLLFLNRDFDLSSISLFFLCLSVSVMLFELPAGMLADAKGARLVIILSRVFKLAAFVGLLYATNILLVCLVAILWGIASALDSGAVQAYTFQLAREKGMSDTFEVVYGRTFTASLLGLLLAGLTASQVSWLGFAVLQYTGIGALFLCVVSALALPPVQATGAPSGKEGAPSLLTTFHSLKKLSPALLILLSIGILAGGIKGSLDEYTTILLANKGLAAGVIGYSIFGLEILRTTGALVAAKFTLTARKQVFVLALLGAAFLAAAFGSIPVTIGALILVLFIDAVLWVHNDAAIQRSATDHNRATVASLKSFGTEVLAGSLFLVVWLCGDGWSVTSVYAASGVLLLSLVIPLLLSKGEDRAG